MKHNHKQRCGPYDGLSECPVALEDRRHFHRVLSQSGSMMHGAVGKWRERNSCVMFIADWSAPRNSKKIYPDVQNWTADFHAGV
jgi:hypothetical protein